MVSFVRIWFQYLIKKERRTLGAKLTILPQPFNLKSELTTPFIRVPRSSFFLFSKTAALSSKRIYLPSGRMYSFFVRTMRARCTSPRRTLTMLDVGALLGIGRARLTTHTISSPTVPTPGVLFAFSTFTHSTRSAPELSMTYYWGQHLAYPTLLYGGVSY